jgi:hypothetical protein
LDRSSKLYSVVSKMSAEAQKVIVVPVSSVGAPLASGACGTPTRYDWVQTWPSRWISTSSRDDRALTTETPTPCNPPETL